MRSVEEPGVGGLGLDRGKEKTDWERTQLCGVDLTDWIRSLLWRL